MSLSPGPGLFEPHCLPVCPATCPALEAQALPGIYQPFGPEVGAWLSLWPGAPLPLPPTPPALSQTWTERVAR